MAIFKGVEMVILSGNNAELNKHRNDLLAQSLGADLKREGFYVSPVDGHFEGKRENSFLVLIHNEKELEEIFSLASKYNQDCLILLGSIDKDHNRSAVMVDVETQEPSYTATFTQVTYEQATKNGDYSQMTYSGQCYILKGDSK